MHSIQHNMTQSGDFSETVSVSEQYIFLLRKWYADQRATVLTDVDMNSDRSRDKERRPFEQSPLQHGSSISNGKRH